MGILRSHRLILCAICSEMWAFVSAVGGHFEHIYRYKSVHIRFIDLSSNLTER